MPWLRYLSFSHFQQFQCTLNAQVYNSHASTLEPRCCTSSCSPDRTMQGLRVWAKGCFCCCPLGWGICLASRWRHRTIPASLVGCVFFWRGRHMSRDANILHSSTIYRKWNCGFELNHISFGAKALPRLDWTHVLQTSLWANSPMCAAFLCIWMQLYVHCTTTKV